jgi:hypothetical protein
VKDSGAPTWRAQLEGGAARLLANDLSGLREPWQVDGEHAADTDAITRPHRATHCLDRALADQEAEPEARLVLPALPEAPEEVIDLSRPHHAAALVLDLDHDAVWSRDRGQAHVALFVAELEGVLQQI